MTSVRLRSHSQGHAQRVRLYSGQTVPAQERAHRRHTRAQVEAGFRLSVLRHIPQGEEEALPAVLQDGPAQSRHPRLSGLQKDAYLLQQPVSRGEQKPADESATGKHRGGQSEEGEAGQNEAEDRGTIR